MYSDEKLTAFEGNYRGAIQPEPSELYHDGWNMGNSYEEVDPSKQTFSATTKLVTLGAGGFSPPPLVVSNLP
jgi:hypothetical protein